MTESNDPRKHQKFVFIGVLSGIFAIIAGISILLYWPATISGTAVTNPEQIALGRTVYQQNCASCHGSNLEGQPDWKMSNPDGRLPAPPHDASGHTWHHPDGVLLQIINKGSAEFIGDGYESDMPGFKELLSDEEIEAVLSFIKNDWPEREREYQARLSKQEKETEK